MDNKTTARKIIREKGDSRQVQAIGQASPVNGIEKIFCINFNLTSKIIIFYLMIKDYKVFVLA
ncbi:MAG: hypothetical protein Q8905_03355 [Bacteroidota bacterium]|nr:hypothetical protein [Bacteroidota bacterium]